VRYDFPELSSCTQTICYAPEVFSHIRSACNIQAELFLWAWLVTRSKKKKNLGKSGSKFFFARDRRFLLKSLTEKDALNLLHILPTYHRHTISHPDSSIMKVYGVFSLQEPSIGPLSKPEYFAVLENVFNDHPIETVFDLKGCTVRRKAKEGASILLDLDWKHTLYIGKMQRDQLLALLEVDCSWLRETGLMDYSLIVGYGESVGESSVAAGSSASAGEAADDQFVWRLSSEEDLTAEWIVGMEKVAARQVVQHSKLRSPIRGILLTEDGQSREVGLCVGLVDIFEHYDSYRMILGYGKRVFWNKRGLSSVPPGYYADRFLERMSDKFRELDGSEEERPPQGGEEITPTE